MQQAKWDKRYSETSHQGSPAFVLSEHLDLLPDARSNHLVSLDAACGLAANGLLLAELGFKSYCWDLSVVAINKVIKLAAQRGLPVQAAVRDIEQQPPSVESFDVIVVSRYLHRPLCNDLAAALKPGGLLFYQTFALYEDGSVPASGPQNPAYRLTRGELKTLFPTLNVLRYQEASTRSKDVTGLINESYLIAQA